MKIIKTFDDAIVIQFSKREAERYASLLMNALVKDATNNRMLDKLWAELESNNLDPLDYGLKTEQLTLMPSPTDVRSRFEQFKELIFNFYKYINSGTAPVWDASDSKQLHNLLRVRLDLTVQEFREWLVNYMESQNVNCPDRPRMFLPRITSYANGPLDKYGKPLVVPKRRIL